MNTKRQRARPLDGAVNPNAETASQQSPVPDKEAERHERIAVAAYYRAERRGFREGGEHDDWVQAEKDIDRKDNGEARPSPLEDQVGSPDHMAAREPLPAGQPHDPRPERAKGARAKKPPERRAKPRQPRPG